MHTVKVGRVIDTFSPMHDGRVKIKPLQTDEGDVILTEIDAVCLSPNVGAGHGIFNNPGPGSTVLYYSTAELPDMVAKYIPTPYICIGAVPETIVTTQGQNVLGNSAFDADDANNTERDSAARMPGEDGVILENIPEANNIYTDNNIPQGEMWKSAAGGVLAFFNKITGQRMRKTVELKAPSGKGLILDDGVPENPGMDTVTLTDERHNKLQITTGGDRPDMSELYTGRDQDYISKEGTQHHMILTGTGNQLRDNKATGNIEDHAYKGKHITHAETEIKRKCFNGPITELAPKGNILYEAGSAQKITLKVDGTTVDITKDGLDLTCGASVINMTDYGLDLTCGTSVIKMTPVSIDIGSIGGTIHLCAPAGDVHIGAVSLLTHFHTSPFFGLPTTKPTSSTPPACVPAT